jgi:hypothetical protein
MYTIEMFFFEENAIIQNVLGSNSNGTVPLVLDLEDSSGAEPVGHGAEGRAAHVEVRSLGLADPVGAGVGDGDRHWLAGAVSVAGALDLHIWNVAHKKGKKRHIRGKTMECRNARIY